MFNKVRYVRKNVPRYHDLPNPWLEIGETNRIFKRRSPEKAIPSSKRRRSKMNFSFGLNGKYDRCFNTY